MSFLRLIHVCHGTDVPVEFLPKKRIVGFKGKNSPDKCFDPGHQFVSVKDRYFIGIGVRGSAPDGSASSFPQKPMQNIVFGSFPDGQRQPDAVRLMVCTEGDAEAGRKVAVKLFPVLAVVGKMFSKGDVLDLV